MIEARRHAGGMASTANTALSRWTGDEMQRRVAKRYAAERRFRLLGLTAVALSVAFLAFLLVIVALAIRPHGLLGTAGVKKV